MSSSKLSIVLAATALLVSVLFATPLGQAAGNLILPKNSVGAAQLKKNAVTGPKVKDNSLTGADVLESALGKIPTAANADRATHAASADNAVHSTSADTAATASSSTNAAQLGGLAAASYQQKCSNGTIKGYVFVNGSASFPSTYTSDPAKVSSSYNCGGGTVEARRASAGNYFVRFNGNPSTLALGNQEVSNFVGFVELEPINPGEFEVYNVDGLNHNADTGFVIALL
jgi:type IV secretory pathway TrbL component